MPRTADALYLGKSCEHQIFAALLNDGLDVYTPLVDSKGVDCLVETKDKKYITIQIKARQTRSIFNIGKPLADYFFLLTPDGSVYLVPNKTIKRWLNGRVKFKLGVRRKKEADKKYKLNLLKKDSVLKALGLD